MAGLSGPDGEHPTPEVGLRRARSERGSTLVELLIATAIMGIAAVSILVGSSVTFETSGLNRQSTTAGIVARDYAEALDVAVTSSTWCVPPGSAYPVAYVPPTGYTVSVVLGACPPTGAQFQTVVITATGTSGATETLRTVVREP